MISRQTYRCGICAGQSELKLISQHIDSIYVERLFLHLIHLLLHGWSIWILNYFRDCHTDYCIYL